ncbi:MAG: polyprenyl synthetase family protein [bacterium]
MPTRLKKVMRYAVFSEGKRLRPILALESYRACGGRKLRLIMPFCCGIELIHTFSLIHDDLPAWDNDAFRRGKPAVNRQFDAGRRFLLVTPFVLGLLNFLPQVRFRRRVKLKQFV